MPYQVVVVALGNPVRRIDLVGDTIDDGGAG